MGDNQKARMGNTPIGGTMDDTQKLPSQQELNAIWRSIDPDLPDFRFRWSAKRTRTAGTIFHGDNLIVLSVKHYLEFGIGEVKETLKHEAAHYLAWLKHKSLGHGKWSWYYLGALGGSRHCPSLSANMAARRIRVKYIIPKKHIEYDPVTKTFRQFYQ